jgi:ribosomal subunit interface protein
MLTPTPGQKEEVKMEIRVQSLKFDADQKLLDFVQKKVSKVERFDETITSVDVSLSLLERPENKNVKLQAHVPGETLVIERASQTFEEAVNEAVDAMKEKIIRSKEKRYNA